jgi:hypothetical protein
MVDHFMRFQLLRLAYGVMLGALLFTPFGVYHSRVEPYIIGYLWGYNLPVGYVGVLLGILAVLYPRLNALRRLRFSSFMPFIGLFLLLSFFFSPKDYFINLIHGTNFSPAEIDVDFAVGNSAVLGLSLLSIAFGLVSFIRGWLPKETKMPSRALYQHMFKGGNESLLTGMGVALIVLGLGFCFFSSFYVDGYLPAAAVFDVIGHYLEGIAIGCAFIASGVILVVFGIEKSQNNYSTPQTRTSENCIEGWLPKEPHSSGYQRTTNHKPPKIGLQIGIVTFVMGLVGGLLGAFASSLGLFSALGVYVYAIIIVVGITIVAATIIIRKKQKEEQQRS